MKALASSLALMLAALSPQAGAASPPGIPEPGWPADTRNESSEILWKNSTNRELRDPLRGRSWETKYAYKHWDTATDAWRDLPIPDDFHALWTAATGAGWFSVGARTGSTVPLVFWLPDAGRVFSQPLTVARDPAVIVPLADQSLLLVGGRMNGDRSRTGAVEHVRRVPDGLVVERLPDVPGPLRHGYAVVALADGRAMLLGGTSWDYVGCGGCLAETYILDPKTRSWAPGPRLLEPRADASATRLPDGSVLVAGGWTPGHDWNEEASRSTERWRPGEGAFAAGVPLPMAAAGHQAKWLAGATGRVLLLVGGFARAWEGNDAIVAFDVARNAWRTVGEGCPADGKRGELPSFGTLIYRGEPFAWCSEEALRRGAFRPVRLPGTSAPMVSATEAQGYALRRGHAAVAPGRADGRLLLAGGTWAASGTQSTAVDLFDADGRLWSLPPLNHLRDNAQAFALPAGGFLVVGGVAGGPPDRASAARPERPWEWLPGGADLSTGAWRDIESPFPADTIFGQDAGGELIAVAQRGLTIRRAKLVVGADGTPSLHESALPALNRPRVAGNRYDGGSPLTVRGLPDGRIIVAGGSVHARRIAVLGVESLEEDAADDYEELGALVPARQHEMLDPANGQWRLSAIAEGTGGPAAILDGGEVVMLTPGRVNGEQRADGSWPISEGILEISAGNGSAWRRLSPLPQLRLDEHARPFVIHGELMMSGIGSLDAGGEPTILQWFDRAGARWVTLWEAPKQTNWREHLGRVVVRSLRGMPVAVPVGGCR